MIFRATFCWTVLCLCVSCGRKQAQTPDAPEPSDHSYLDLTAGSRLRILMPILAKNEEHVMLGKTKEQDHKLSISATNLLGF